MSTGAPVSTLAGSGRKGFEDGQGAAASFSEPNQMVLEDDGSILVSDVGNHCIRRVAKDGTVTTVCGSGRQGFADGQGRGAHFSCPCGIQLDDEGNILVADTKNHRIRQCTPAGLVTTLAGNGQVGNEDGPFNRATFNHPRDVAMDRDGNLLVVCNDGTLRKLNLIEGMVTTLATRGQFDSCPFGGGDFAVDENGCVLLQCWERPNAIVRFDPAEAKVQPLGSPSRQSVLEESAGLAIDGEGRVIVAASGTHRICAIGPGGGDPKVIAGSGRAAFGDGLGEAAHFLSPSSVVIDHDGNLLVADRGNNRIRRIVTGYIPPERRDALPPELPSVFVQQMLDLWADTASADVHFLVNGETISAHSIILSARSDYFRAMLTGGLREGRGRGGGGGAPSSCSAPSSSSASSIDGGAPEDAATSDAGKIRIGDTTPDAFRALLRYLYTDELTFPDEQIIDVMRKAKEMHLERPYNYAVRRSRRDINVHNVVAWFVKADEFGLAELRAATFRFLARNLKDVRARARQSLTTHLANKPHLLMEVMLEAI